MRLALHLVLLFLMAAPTEAAPNIVVIYADDLGYGDISIENPEGKIPTPNIDQLASEGLYAVDAHSSASVCSPSRYAIQTGREGFRAVPRGVVDFFGPPVIQQGTVTVASMLKEKGYETGFFGKWHLGSNWQTTGQSPNWDTIDWGADVTGGPGDFGYDEDFRFDGPLPIDNGHVVSAPILKPPSYPWFGHIVPELSLETRQPMVVRKAIDWLKTRDQNAPFFAFISFPAIHTPIAPIKRWNPNVAGPYGMYVQELDEDVGKILEALDPFPDTLVIFTSDNGAITRDGTDYNGNVGSLQSKWGHDPNKGRRGRKKMIYEGGHRVPFIVRWPGHVTPGTVKPFGNYITQTDLLRTIARVVEYDVPQDQAIDSFDMTPLLFNWAAEGPIREWGINSSWDGTLCIRDLSNNLKYIDGAGDGSGKFDPGHQLFDLTKDPTEQALLPSKKWITFRNQLNYFRTHRTHP